MTTEIQEVTPLQTLRNAHFHLAGQQSTSTGQVLSVALNNAHPTTPISRLAAEAVIFAALSDHDYADRAEALGNANPIELRLSRRPQPRHYIIFADTDQILREIGPANTPSGATGWGMTNATNPRATISFVQAKDLDPTSAKAADTQVCNSVLEATASPAFVTRSLDQRQANHATPPMSRAQLQETANYLTQEIICNSFGEAAYEARDHIPYQQYLQRVPTMSVATAGEPSVVPLDEDTYRKLASVS